MTMPKAASQADNFLGIAADLLAKYLKRLIEDGPGGGPTEASPLSPLSIPLMAAALQVGRITLELGDPTVNVQPVAVTDDDDAKASDEVAKPNDGDPKPNALLPGSARLRVTVTVPVPHAIVSLFLPSEATVSVLRQSQPWEPSLSPDTIARWLDMASGGASDWADAQALPWQSRAVPEPSSPGGFSGPAMPPRFPFPFQPSAGLPAPSGGAPSPQSPDSFGALAPAAGTHSPIPQLGQFRSLESRGAFFDDFINIALPGGALLELSGDFALHRASLEPPWTLEGPIRTA